LSYALPKSNCLLLKCTEPCEYYHLWHEMLEAREIDELNILFVSLFAYSHIFKMLFLQ